jgi:hypothetical protein
VVDQARIIVDDLASFTERNIRRLSVEVHANLVAAPTEGGTPVDTGWARANWVPAIGNPVTDVDGEPPKKGTKTKAGGKAQRGLARVASSYRLRQGPVFISNNVPYIGRLNDGSSVQAPRGFVQAAILKAIRAVVASPAPQ